MKDFLKHMLVQVSPTEALLKDTEQKPFVYHLRDRYLEGTPTEQGGATFVVSVAPMIDDDRFTILRVGYALCHPDDSYEKRVGRAIASNRWATTPLFFSVDLPWILISEARELPRSQFLHYHMFGALRNALVANCSNCEVLLDTDLDFEESEDEEPSEAEGYHPKGYSDRQYSIQLVTRNPEEGK